MNNQNGTELVQSANVARVNNDRRTDTIIGIDIPNMNVQMMITIALNVFEISVFIFVFLFMNNVFFVSKIVFLD